jgi:hypothetical protein
MTVAEPRSIHSANPAALVGKRTVGDYPGLRT